MYPNYNMVQSYPNMYRRNQNFYRNQRNINGDRFIGGGLIAPLLLGGIAGYAIGRPNYYPYPYNYYYNNYYYPPYPYYY